MQKQIKQNFIRTGLSLFSFILVWAFLLGLPLSQVHASYEISDGSVKALWHFNGDSTDSSGNANNGTDSSMSYTSAKLGNGAHFSGSGKITMTDSTSLSIGSTGTWNVWIKPSNVTTNGRGQIYSQWVASHYAFEIWQYANSGQLACDESTANTPPSGQTMNSTSNLGTSWQMLTYVKNGVNTAFYINGTSAGSSGTMTTALNNSTADFIIGQNGNTDGFFNGDMDEFSVTNTAWSTSTILAVYNSGAGQEICTTAGCGATTSTSTSLSTSTDCNIGTDSVDWTLIQKAVEYIFYLLLSVLILSLAIVFLFGFFKRRK